MRTTTARTPRHLNGLTRASLREPLDIRPYLVVIAGMNTGAREGIQPPRQPGCPRS